MARGKDKNLALNLAFREASLRMCTAVPPSSSLYRHGGLVVNS